MPNYCSNALIVTGSKSAIADPVRVATQFNEFKVQVVDATSNEEKLMDKFFPMPQELKDIHLGCISIDNVMYARWIEKKVDGKIERTGLTDDDLTKLEVKYGARDWYDWAMTMYGCKWDTTATIVDLSDDKTIHLLFETPWSPPEAFVKRLSEQYPDLHFELAYCEGGSGYWGTTSYANGCIIESTYNEDGIYLLVPEEADYDDYDLLPEAAAHIEKYHIGTGG